MKHRFPCRSRRAPRAFSTLDSGLRDETCHVFHRVARILPLSVPSTRVYAMKQDDGLARRNTSSTFSTLDSGLRDETRLPYELRRQLHLSVPSTRVYAMKPWRMI